MTLEIIEKDIKPSKSFYRLSDRSWCEIATRWGKDPRTGLIVCKGQDESIPTLVELLSKEGKERKYVAFDTYSKVIIGDEKFKFSNKVLSKLREL